VIDGIDVSLTCPTNPLLAKKRERTKLDADHTFFEISFMSRAKKSDLELAAFEKKQKKASPGCLT
jgi:hypothetical protein